MWLVDDFVKNPTKESGDRIKAQYQVWINNHPKLKETMKSAPAIREVEPVSENLAKLSVIGIELVDYILLKSSKKLKIKMTYKEHDDKEDEIRFMVKPKGNVEIIVLINATKKLLETAIE
ncbi:hypothetical protein D3C79_966390 [compost metagenome]